MAKYNVRHWKKCDRRPGGRKGKRNCVSKSGRASAFPAQHVRYGERERVSAGERRALLYGILISVNYSREWHVLLTSALSSRSSGRIQFSPSFSPLSRSFLPRADLTSRISLSLLLREEEVIGRYYLEMREG